MRTRSLTSFLLAIAVSGETARAQGGLTLGELPGFQTDSPVLSLELSGALRAYSGRLLPEQGDSKLRSFAFAGQLYPLVGSAGVLAIGPSVTWYPFTRPGGLAMDSASSFAVGARAEYQTRFTPWQMLFPAAGVEGQYFIVEVPRQGPVGRIGLVSPYFSLAFNLSRLEKVAAGILHESAGIARTFLIAEYRMVIDTMPGELIRASTATAGLRFEWN